MKFGKRKKEEIAVFGIGKLGTEIIRNLALLNKYFIIAIDRNKNSLENVRGIADVLLIGDAAEEEFLDENGLADASYFIISIGDDLQSSILVSSIISDKYDGKLIVRSEDRIHRNILKKIGISTIINPNLDSAEKIAFELNVPELSTVLNIENIEFRKLDENILFGKIMIPNQLWNKKIKDANVPKDILIAFYTRNKESHIADGETILRENDEISIMGNSKSIFKYLENMYDSK